MKPHKRKFVLIYISLSVFIFILIFASCKTENNDGNTQKTPDSDSSLQETEAEEKPAEISDNLPEDLDFAGTTVTVIQKCYDISWPCCREFFAEAENGDIFNDTIYRRNMTVEERLNVKFNLILEDPGSLPNKVRASVSSGDHTYDLIAAMCGNIGTLAVDGLLMNLRNVPHIDFDKPWWNRQIVNGASVGNKLYFIAGDANLSVLMSSMLLFVNKKLIEENALPDIYEVVIDGKWTIDYMSDYIKGIGKDLNGDGVMDKNDLFGYVTPGDNFINSFMEGAGIQLTKIGDDGKPYFDMPVERMSGLADKIGDFLYNNPNTFISPGNDLEVDMFRNNQALFLPYAVQDAVYWKDMEEDFGMIPYPKYDESQEKYYSSVWTGCSMFCIPANSVTPEMAGAFMEAMSSESYRTTTPTYFDIVLKLKEARDETTSKMLDIIRDGAYIDFSTIFNAQLGGPWGALTGSIMGKTNNFASWYEKNAPRIQKAMDTLLEKMENIE